MSHANGGYSRAAPGSVGTVDLSRGRVPDFQDTAGFTGQAAEVARQRLTLPRCGCSGRW